MGIWEFMSGTTETIKNASVASYGYCTATASSIGNLYGYIPDQDRRTQIASFTGKLAKNAALHGLHEGYKLIPGGKTVGKIVSMTANDMKAENLQKQREMTEASKEHKAMKSTTQNSPIADSALVMKSENRKSERETEVSSKEHRAMKSTTQNSPLADLASDMKPDDVLRVFMMKEFIGTHFLDDLVVPGAKKSKL